MRQTLRAVFMSFMLAASCAWADLSTPQMLVLKGVAAADPVASTYMDGAHDVELSAWFNGAGTCTVWKTSVPIRDVYDKTSATATTWDWTTYISNTTAAERDAWREMSSQGGALNPSLAQVRAGWAKIFSGTGAAVVAQRAHLSAISQRSGTRAECTLANAEIPAVMSFEGSISPATASTIRSL